MTATATTIQPSSHDFQQMVSPHIDALRHAALRLCRDRVRADDLVQDTMLRALRFWEDQDGNVKAWLLSIMRNTFINDCHKATRRQTAERNLAAEVRSVGSLGANVARPPGPAECIEASRVKSLVSDALASLPADFRDAIRMADFEGLSYKEIAEAMDCPIGTVMSRLYRGRRQLGWKLGGTVDNVIEIGDWRKA